MGTAQLALIEADAWLRNMPWDDLITDLRSTDTGACRKAHFGLASLSMGLLRSGFR